MQQNVELTHSSELLLQKYGFRNTEPRRLILDVLASGGDHLTAEEIYQEVRQRSHHVNFATIYRTLTTFRESGLVQQYYVSPEHTESRFRLLEPVEKTTAGTPKVPKNLNFHCLTCGKITTLDDSEVVALILKTIEKQISGFQLKQVCMCIEGYCSQCANKEAEAAR